MAELIIPCRLCSNFSDPITDNIFSGDNEHLLDIILKYLSVKITSEDILSTNVCETCKSVLQSFHEFALKCAAVQVKLSSFKNSYEQDGLNHFFLEVVKCEYKEEILDNMKTEKPPYKTEHNEGKSFLDDENSFSNNSFEETTPKVKKKKIKLNKVKPIVIKKNKIISKSKRETRRRASPSPEPSIKKKKSDLFEINNSFLSFCCHKCPQVFSTWASLARHTKESHDAEPMIPCLCGKYLRTKKSLYAHILSHDKSKGSQCDICKKTFISEKRYKIHLATHDSNKPIYHDCPDCNKRCADRSALRKHLRKHIPIEERSIHPCSICGSKFTTKSYVNEHIRNFHHNIKAHMCDICGKEFNTKGALKGHKFLHATERPHQCPLCPKSYKTKPPLKRHLNIHNGIRFKCEKCPSEFNMQSTLESHMRVHQDIIRYVCSFCNKGFKWISSFKAHVNKHTGTMPFSCLWCPRTFVDASNCRIHKKRKHPTELAEYEARTGKNTNNMKIVPSKPQVTDEPDYKANILPIISEDKPVLCYL